MNISSSFNDINIYDYYIEPYEDFMASCFQIRKTYLAHIQSNTSGFDIFES